MLTTEKEQVIEQVIDQVIAIASEMETYSPSGPVLAESRFDEDLGIDSLAMIDLVVALEKHFKVVTDEADVPEVETVNDLAEVIRKSLTA